VIEWRREGMSAVFVFPGQGPQSVGMGGPLFPVYRDMVGETDEILGYSIERLCLEDPDS
jgi:malonyl CoA-acyl carrier protein transacylase